MEIFGLDCLITKATRKTKTSETLLDLILTSNKKKTLVSDVVDTQISDHSLVLQFYGQELQDRALVCENTIFHFKTSVETGFAFT